MSTETTTAQLDTTTTLKIDEIHPYENNPRDISETAVEKVAESIERYGYQQPIVVDSEHVVIVGHTRLAALKHLGWASVEVIVANLPDEKAREYRLADNKTGELSEWDHEALVTELREWEDPLLEEFFPDVDLEVSQLKSEEVDADDIQDAVDKVTTTSEPAEKQTTTVECPECHDTFRIDTSSVPGMTPEHLTELKELRG